MPEENKAKVQFIKVFKDILYESNFQVYFMRVIYRCKLQVSKKWTHLHFDVGDAAVAAVVADAGAVEPVDGERV